MSDKEALNKAIAQWKAVPDDKRGWVFQALMECSDAACDAGNDVQADAYDTVSAMLRAVTP